MMSTPTPEPEPDAISDDAGSESVRSPRLVWSPASGLRASDADREQAADVLRQAAGDGRITFHELDQRLETAYVARTHAELETVTGDLTSRFGETATVSAAAGGTRWVMSIMSGHHLTGRWRIASRCNVINVMGGSQLDLTHAELSDPVTTITVVSIMGGGEIRVPDGVEVRVSKLGLMGGSDVKLNKTPPPPGSPIIRIHLLSIMGGTRVEQGPKMTRAETHEPRRMQKGARPNEIQ